MHAISDSFLRSSKSSRGRSAYARWPAWVSRRRWPVLLLVCLFPVNSPPSSFAEGPEVSFQDVVLPLLSDRCFTCHGPDEAAREADFRLDDRDAAVEDRGGYHAIFPGNSGESEVIKRITTTDEFMRMPPPESGVKPLSETEIDAIRRWIDAGAVWENHWSFERVERPEIPAVHSPEVNNKDWPRNPIDHFVLARLEREGIDPSPSADKRSLLRRASLTLTGLPPTREDVETFLRDHSSDAYERAVDRLLASPHYGERMAYVWLDAARYADTDSYQQDEERTNWPWRDWVVRAYNSNMPFDQFTIEQFAGDLLPDPTPDQIIATCFHRNHMTNGEGGRDPEESRVDYVLDRVNTMGTAWLGLTLECTQCHTHKYDPISHHEYYELTAFFNSIAEDGRAGNKADPYYPYPLAADSPYREQLLEPHRKKLTQAEERAAQILGEAEGRFDAWLEEHSEKLANVVAQPTDWQPVKPQELQASVPEVKLQIEDGRSVLATGANPNNVNYEFAGETSLDTVTALRLEALPHKGHTAGGLARSNSGNFVLTGLEVRVREPGKKSSLPLTISRVEAEYEQPGYVAEYTLDGRSNTGWAVWSGDITRPRALLIRLKEPTKLREGAKLVVRLKHESKHENHNIGRFRISATGDPAANLDCVSRGPLGLLAGGSQSGESPLERLTDADRQQLFDYFIQHDGQVGLSRAQEISARRSLEQAEANAHVSVMVLQERDTPRKTHVLLRGEWDQHGDQVEPNVPRILGDLPAEERDRLTLARWLVNRENPLTARVTVNRYWQMHFGAGLVRTPEDFGLQGERPTHPDLLDWLAAEFMDSGWDVKAMQRLIVTSATFRQSSRHRTELDQIDPENRLLARGPRFRLPASIIRDSTLQVSDLLSDAGEGPPVKPYQPDGVWQDANQGKYVYELSEGEQLYRRSLYTFWRRNATPPAMFDASDRRTCSVGAVRTNSPMQALNLLNDITYVEAARVLAEHALKQDQGAVEKQLAWAFEKALCRPPDEHEASLLTEQFAHHLAEFTADPAAANQLLQVGESPVDEHLDRPALAAMTVTMSIVLNLDETLNLE